MQKRYICIKCVQKRIISLTHMYERNAAVDDVVRLYIWIICVFGLLSPPDPPSVNVTLLSIYTHLTFLHHICISPSKSSRTRHEFPLYTHLTFLHHICICMKCTYRYISSASVAFSRLQIPPSVNMTWFPLYAHVPFPQTYFYMHKVRLQLPRLQNSSTHTRTCVIVIYVHTYYISTYVFLYAQSASLASSPPNPLHTHT